MQHMFPLYLTQYLNEIVGADLPDISETTADILRKVCEKIMTGDYTHNSILGLIVELTCDEINEVFDTEYNGEIQLLIDELANIKVQFDLGSSIELYSIVDHIEWNTRLNTLKMVFRDNDSLALNFMNSV